MEQTENKLRIHFFNTNVLDNRFTHSEGLKMALRGCFKNILEINNYPTKSKMGYTYNRMNEITKRL